MFQILDGASVVCQDPDTVLIRIDSMIESTTNDNEFRSKDGTVVRIPDADFNIIPRSVTRDTKLKLAWELDGENMGIGRREHGNWTERTWELDGENIAVAPDKALLVKLFYVNKESATIALRKFRFQKNVKSGKGPLTPAGVLKLVKRFEEPESWRIEHEPDDHA
ncbi:hypothetical protein TNCV_3771321 [Trichonephila clavipes]|nr:hypothetical protein TNCV_3771321 [Trichonephila clavipes]